jgi:DNA/RNA endonuclease YhcR with UshA esterase domain
MTIKQIIEECVDGQVIPFITATVKTVYPMTTENPDGSGWKMQNAILEDATGTIKVTFSNRKSDASILKGHEFTFKSKKSDKHGLQGVFAKDNEYNNNKTRELRVSASADIVPTSKQKAENPVKNESAGGSVSDKSVQSSEQSKQEDAKSAEPKQPYSPELAGDVRVKAEFYKTSKLHAYAIAAAIVDAAWFKEFTGDVMPNDMFLQAIDKIFYETCKRLPATSPAIGYPEKKHVEKPKQQAPKPEHQPKEGDPF